MSNLSPCAISWTSLWKGSLQMRSSVILWYLQMSPGSTVPGLNLPGCRAAQCWVHTCLFIMVTSALVWPDLGLSTPSVSCSILEPSSLGPLVTPSRPPWPVRLWPRRHSGDVVPWPSPIPLEKSQGVGIWLHLPPCSWHHLVHVASPGGQDFSTPYVCHVQWAWLTPLA